MTRRALALACALLTVAVSVVRASDRGGESTLVAVRLDDRLDRALLARVQVAPARGARSRVIIRTVDGRPATALIDS